MQRIFLAYLATDRGDFRLAFAEDNDYVRPSTTALCPRWPPWNKSLRDQANWSRWRGSFDDCDAPVASASLSRRLTPRVDGLAAAVEKMQADAKMIKYPT